MPEPKRPLKVFLCHASTDKPKVRELYRYLKKRGIQPWFDEEDLVGGQDWQVEIPKALATSDAIIICLTKNSVDKEGYIQKEIKFALDKALEMPEGRIFLIPVKFEECEVPFTLSRYQWVDLTIESGYAKMMKALKFRASQLERSTVEISKKDVVEKNIVREKAEKEAAEKTRLETEELARQKTAKEKSEREAAEKAAREREEKETAEKARLESEELTRQKAANEKAVREKQESEAAEKTKGERVEKEAREKQERKAVKEAKQREEKTKKEARQEKLTREAALKNNSKNFESKKVQTSGKVNPVIFVALIFLVGAVVGLFGLSLSVMPKWLFPESATATITSTSQPNISTQSVEPSLTPVRVVVPTFTPVETHSSNIEASDNSKNLYFVSEDKYLYVLNTLTEQTQRLFHLERFNDYMTSDGVFVSEYSTLSWLDSSDLAIWLSKEYLVLNLKSKNEKNIPLIEDQYAGVASSDLSSDGRFVLHNSSSWEKSYTLMSAIDNQSSSLTVSKGKSDLDNYRRIFCVKRRPNDDFKVALIVSELNGSLVGDPSLALLEVASTSYPPVIIKKQVDGCISWSPDGKYIAYGNGKVRHESANDFPKGIFYIDFASGSVTKLSDTDGYYPDWSSDGNTIAFLTDKGISLVDVNTKEEDQIYSGKVLALLWGK